MTSRLLRVLDLCAGTGSATDAFRDAGHQVIRLELDARFEAELSIDVRDFAKNPQLHLDRIAIELGWIRPGEHWVPDIVWASPPCTAFSMAGSGKGRVRWEYLAKGQEHPFYGPRVPIHEASRVGCEVVLACLQAIRVLDPRYWWLENPQGGLQTMGFMRDVPGPATVTYCAYGDSRMKPTVLWGVWPKAWKPRPRCQNGDSCHVSAPRGSRSPGSTQGLRDAKERAMVPTELSRSILASVVEDVSTAEVSIP